MFLAKTGLQSSARRRPLQAGGGGFCTLRGAPPQHTWDLARFGTKHLAVIDFLGYSAWFSYNSQNIFPNVWVCVWASLFPNQAKTNARIPPNSIQKSQKSISQMYPNPPLNGSFWGQNPPFSRTWPPRPQKGEQGSRQHPFPGGTLGAILVTFGSLGLSGPLFFRGRFFDVFFDRLFGHFGSQNASKINQK